MSKTKIAATRIVRTSDDLPTFLAETSAGFCVVKFHSRECVSFASVSSYDSAGIHEQSGNAEKRNLALSLCHVDYSGTLTLRPHGYGDGPKDEEHHQCYRISRKDETGYRVRNLASVHFDRSPWSGSYSRDQLTSAARKVLLALAETVVGQIVEDYPNASGEGELHSTRDRIERTTRDIEDKREELRALEDKCAELQETATKLENVL
jgi:hypothetical protein